MSVLQTQLNSRSADFLANAAALQTVVDDLRVQLKKSAAGGGEKAKAKQKNVYKASTTPKSMGLGGRIFLDLSKVTVSRSDGSNFELKKKWWKIMVDQAT